MFLKHGRSESLYNVDLVYELLVRTTTVPLQLKQIKDHGFYCGTLKLIEGHL